MLHKFSSCLSRELSIPFTYLTVKTGLLTLTVKDHCHVIMTE